MNTVDLNLLKSIGIGPPKDAQAPRSRSAEEMGANDFMTLLLAQIKHQDPFKSQENGEFISQMAQFSTVSGVEKLNKSFSALSGALSSNQALQGASMIGRKVEVPTNKILHASGESHKGTINLPMTSTNVRVTISNKAGETVNAMNLGMQKPGAVDYTWDGNDQSGAAVQAGQYNIIVEATVGGKTSRLDAYMDQTVTSITLPSSGKPMQLELGNGQVVELSQVRQIR